MLKNLLTAAAMSIAAASAFADDAARAAAQRTIELKDGSTLYLFKDGKMSMADKFGRPMRMKRDVVMETKDGEKIIMHGDEVARLESLSRKGHEGGN